MHTGLPWDWDIRTSRRASHKKNLTLTRLGFEYGFHLPQNWEVGAAVVWDNKWNYYNSWGLAFTFSKIWTKE